MLTAWTTYAELNDDQRERFGKAVQFRDQSRAEASTGVAAADRAKRNLIAAGGDTLKALSLSLAQTR